MRAAAVTQGLQFSSLDVDFYCSISCQLETRGEHLLACKTEPSEGRRGEGRNRDGTQKGPYNVFNIS